MTNNNKFKKMEYKTIYFSELFNKKYYKDTEILNKHLLKTENINLLKKRLIKQELNNILYNEKLSNNLIENLILPYLNYVNVQLILINNYKNKNLVKKIYDIVTLSFFLENFIYFYKCDDSYKNFFSKKNKKYISSIIINTNINYFVKKKDYAILDKIFNNVKLYTIKYYYSYDILLWYLNNYDLNFFFNYNNNIHMGKLNDENLSDLMIYYNDNYKMVEIVSYIYFFIKNNQEYNFLKYWDFLPQKIKFYVIKSEIFNLKEGIILSCMLDSLLNFDKKKFYKNVKGNKFNEYLLKELKVRNYLDFENLCLLKFLKLKNFYFIKDFIEEILTLDIQKTKIQKNKSQKYNEKRLILENILVIKNKNLKYKLLEYYHSKIGLKKKDFIYFKENIKLLLDITNHKINKKNLKNTALENFNNFEYLLSNNILKLSDFKFKYHHFCE